jgi:hypothetical protein
MRGNIKKVGKLKLKNEKQTDFLFLGVSIVSIRRDGSVTK